MVILVERLLPVKISIAVGEKERAMIPGNRSTK